MEELKDTVDRMLSSDYKERFKAEFEQLKIRFDKLRIMVEKWDNNELNFVPTCPREIYTRQLNIMYDYLEVLQERAKLENIEL